MSEVWAKLRTTFSMDASEFKAGAQEATGAVTSLQSTVMKAAGAMGVAFSAAEIISFAKDLAKAAFETVHSAKALDITTEALKNLQMQAVRQGIPGDSVIAWLQKLQAVSADLAVSGGGGELGKMLSEMGVNVREFIGLPLPERLMLLVEKASESELGIKALNLALGRGQAIEAKKAYEDLAKNGIKPVTGEVKELSKNLEILASVWKGGLGAQASLKDRGTNLLGGIVDAHRSMIAFNRQGGLDPKGMDAFAEGVGATAMDLGLMLASLIPGMRKKILDRYKLPDQPGNPTNARSWAGDSQPVDLQGLTGGSTELQQDFDKARQTAENKAQDEATKRIDALRGAYDKSILSRLQGEAKLKQELKIADDEYWNSVGEADKKYLQAMKDEKDEIIRASLQKEKDETLALLRDMHKARIEAAEKTAHDEREKAKADTIKKTTDYLADRQKRREGIYSSTTGAGVNASAGARVGGFTGNERPGLAVQDKQLKIQEQMYELMKEFRTKQTTQAVQDFNTVAHPGLPDGGAYY